tara:strand:- start:2639 stop:2824 length:186 start_codon:yes stop_codon:yes gene_type:complete
MAPDEYTPSNRDRKVRKRRERKEMNKPMRAGGGRDKVRDSERYRKEYEDLMAAFEKGQEDD